MDRVRSGLASLCALLCGCASAPTVIEVERTRMVRPLPAWTEPLPEPEICSEPYTNRDLALCTDGLRAVVQRCNHDRAAQRDAGEPHE